MTECVLGFAGGWVRKQAIAPSRRPAFPLSQPLRTEHREFPGRSSSAGGARQFVREVLGEWGTDADDAALISSELVTNAIRYNGERCTLFLYLEGDRLTVEVEDECTELPILQTPGSRRPNGRGLRIVDALSSRWGFRQVEGGKVVWAEIPAE